MLMTVLGEMQNALLHAAVDSGDWETVAVISNQMQLLHEQEEEGEGEEVSIGGTIGGTASIAASRRSEGE